MPTCGYICPQCEGSGFFNDEPCNWCSDKKDIPKDKKEISDEEWIREVHEGKCCGD
jgi:DnaJ-class molecular chaperone